MIIPAGAEQDFACLCWNLSVRELVSVPGSVTPRSSGYVDTCGSRDSYGYALDGIFFDEADNWGVSYFQQLQGYCDSVGFHITVGNPGSYVQNPAYVNLLSIWNVYENQGTPSLPLQHTSSGNDGFPKSKFSLLAHYLSSYPDPFVRKAAASAGWVYVTNQTEPNPWTQFPWVPQTLATLSSL